MARKRSKQLLAGIDNTTLLVGGTAAYLLLGTQQGGATTANVGTALGTGAANFVVSILHPITQPLANLGQNIISIPGNVGVIADQWTGSNVFETVYYPTGQILATSESGGAYTGFTGQRILKYYKRSGQLYTVLGGIQFDENLIQNLIASG